MIVAYKFLAMLAPATAAKDDLLVDKHGKLVLSHLLLVYLLAPAAPQLSLSHLLLPLLAPTAPQLAWQPLHLQLSLAGDADN